MDYKNLAILTEWPYNRDRVKFNDLSWPEWQMQHTSQSQTATLKQSIGLNNFKKPLISILPCHFFLFKQALRFQELKVIFLSFLLQLFPKTFTLQSHSAKVSVRFGSGFAKQFNKTCSHSTLSLQIFFRLRSPKKRKNIACFNAASKNAPCFTITLCLMQPPRLLEPLTFGLHHDKLRECSMW